jgi:hypothetical protein
MATASPKTVTVEVVEGYTLELTKDEADAVIVVLRNIGGLPSITARRFTDSVGDALRDAGVSYEKAKYRDGFKLTQDSNFYFSPGVRERDLF